MRIYKAVLAIALFPCGLSYPAAEEKNFRFDELLSMEIEELLQVKVVTASRYEQDIYNSSSVISVITREDILRYGGNSLLDVLQYFPGFIPVGDRAFGIHGAMFRGDTNASGEHILTLLDGQPYRSMQTAQYSTSALFRSFPLTAIERIELIHGPGSAIYGTNAMTGVVNIITRKEVNIANPDKTSVSELNIQSGRWDTHRQGLHYGAQHGDWLTRITLQNQKTDGWPITDDVRNVSPSTPFESISVDQQVIHANIENHGFHLRSFLVNYETRFPEFGEETAETNQRYWNVGYQAERADWHYVVDLGFLKVNNTLIGNEVDRNHTLEASAKKQVSDSVNVLFGLSAAEADNKAEGLNLDFYQLRYAAYTQVDYVFNDTFTSFAGIQWNKIESGDVDTSPRLGLIYHHNEYQGLKVLYNEAFRSPTASETDVQFFAFTPAPLLIVSGNSDLEPETVQTLDIQWFSYGKHTLFTFGGFYSHYHGRVFQRPFDPVFLTPLTYLNGESINIWGLELQNKWRINAGHYFELGWTWQRNQTTKTEEYDTTLAPRWTANLGYSYNFTNGAVMSVFHNHVSEFGGNGSSTPTPNPEADAYDLLSVNVRMPLALTYSQHAGIKGDLIFLIQNALDQDVWQPETAVNFSNTYQFQYGRAVYGAVELRW